MMTYKRSIRVVFWSCCGLVALGILLVSNSTVGQGSGTLGILKQPIQAPEFSHSAVKEWLNSEPIRLKDLQGQVVLLDVWTFECWNCYRSFPWLRSVEERYHEKGLQVIGVHTPEFDHERDVDAVREKTVEFKLTHPVMIDNDFSYWRALNNRYWPAFYVIDKRGYIRGIFVGETHTGKRRARVIEGLIEILLAEKR